MPNCLANADALAHLLKYDYVHGIYPGTVEAKDNMLVVDGKTIKVLAERDTAKLPWKEMGVKVAVESTGVFTTQEACMKHVQAGASKVLLTVPPKGEVDAMEVIEEESFSIIPLACITTRIPK